MSFISDVTVASFVNDKYGNVSWKHPWRNSVLLFLFFYKMTLPKCHSLWDYVQYVVISVLQDLQYMFGVRSLLLYEKELCHFVTYLWNDPYISYSLKQL